jgi:hypothetical protein
LIIIRDNFRFSRKVLWLEIGRTNNNPLVVANYFMDYLKGIEGTQNVSIECQVKQNLSCIYNYRSFNLPKKNRNYITGVPRCIQMDRGTENYLIEDIQLAFHMDITEDFCRSVVKSSSHHNQVSILLVLRHINLRKN